jgi:cell division protein FtsW
MIRYSELPVKESLLLPSAVSLPIAPRPLLPGGPPGAPPIGPSPAQSIGPAPSNGRGGDPDREARRPPRAEGKRAESRELLARALPLPPPDGYRADPLLFTVVLSLTAIGLVMVYSSSAIFAQQRFGDSRFFLVRDLIWTLMGLVAMAVTMRIDYSIYRRLAYPLLGMTTMLLVTVLVIGARVNGAKRWFHLGGLSFQPAELAKVALIIYLAHSLSKKAEKVRLFTIGFLPHLLVCGVFMVLLLKQPDLGTAAIMGGVTLLLLFVAGTNISYLFLAALAAMPILYHAVVGTPWRLRRMLAFLDPWQFRDTYGYQTTASLIAVGSGGLSGQGLGDGRQKLFFLPEAHTDYILAIIGEELGLLGIGLVLLLFSLLILAGCRVAHRARDTFGCYLASGITAMFGLQATINIGVVLGALPTKGLTLPLVSFGGSTLVIDLLAVGILLNISRGEPEPTPLQWRLGKVPGLLGALWPSRKNRRRAAARRRAVAPALGTRLPRGPRGQR